MKKKRFIKLCMSMGYSRNTSNGILKIIVEENHSHECGLTEIMLFLRDYAEGYEASDKLIKENIHKRKFSCLGCQKIFKKENSNEKEKIC